MIVGHDAETQLASRRRSPAGRGASADRRLPRLPQARRPRRRHRARPRATTRPHRDATWLIDHFQNPEARRARLHHAAVPLPGRRSSTRCPRTFSSRQTPRRPGRARRSSYKTLCSRCHGEKGDGNGADRQLPRPVAARPHQGGVHAHARRGTASSRTRSKGVPGTSMPPWGKRPRRRAGARRARRLRPRPPSPRSRAADPEARARCRDTNPVALRRRERPSRGEAIFLKRCSGCHGRKADGKGPNSLDILPRPRNLRNTRRSSHASRTRASSSPSSTACRARPCRRWIDYGLDDKDDRGPRQFHPQHEPADPKSEPAKVAVERHGREVAA